ncbi:hypothetical protein [Pseudooceanicola sp. LIPI14-2-Ac024]|uniref:hypothetical protein n=1 Tax=Pseudooceanicola sp. LIPI14-2-Ac024 TaxID=3344875 RepID=UPI0035D11E66
MSAAQVRLFCGILAGYLALQLGLVWLADGFRFARHEGDMLHLAELVLRMASGEVPHRDFVTPIGDLAIRPMAWMMALGTGLGAAMLWGQILVALALIPMVVWTGVSRLRFWLATVFGLVVLGLATAQVFGGWDVQLSLSMHYNRWAWALSFVLVVLVVVPPRGPSRPALDGAVIGLCLAAVALIKASFAVALVLPVLLGLMLQWRRVDILAGLAAGLAVCALYALALGPSFWIGYARDLLQVLGSDIRAYPSHALDEVVLSPLFLPATAVGLAAGLLVRAVDRAAGLTLLMLLPAFAYICYQNFGNDPLWLVPVATCLVAMLPAAETGPRRAMEAAALAGVVVVAPALINTLWSPLRFLSHPRAMFEPLVAEPSGADLLTLSSRIGPSIAFTPIHPVPDEHKIFFRGRELPECKQDGGLVGELRAQVAALAAQGIVTGPQPYVADFQAPHWMLSDLSRLPGAAPWYYDGLPGFGAATHLLVPDCPSKPAVRARILGLIDAAEVPLTEVHHGAGVTLYAIGSAAEEDAQ